VYQNFIIPYLYEAQHVLGDTPPIVRSLKLHWQPLVFLTWKVVGRVVDGQRPPTTRPTSFDLWKTRGCQCSFRLLMMGGVSPETCWVSYKYGIIKFWYIVASCWIFYFESYMWFGEPHPSPKRSSPTRLSILSYATWQRPPTTRPTTFHVRKTRVCQCSFSLLMMGGVSPETCCASYKYGIIKFWYIIAPCWIFLYEVW
jgi:hypothetical protein